MRCPSCATEMLPLFSSMFCPRECDRTPVPDLVMREARFTTCDNMLWRLTVIPTGSPLPGWATHGWNLYHRGTTQSDRSNYDLPIIDLARLWSASIDFPGWPIVPGQIPGFSMGAVAWTVFGRVSQ